MGFRASAPAANTGYNRNSDWPVAGGVGGGFRVDGVSAGIGGAVGLKMGSGNSSATYGGSTQWHPTVTYMFIFVVAELVAFHMLSRFLNI